MQEVFTFEQVAHFVFEGEGNRRLVIEAHIHLQPEASLDSGKWVLIHGTDFGDKGTLLAPALQFLGGQGGSPSVGGTFLLMKESHQRYRAEIPPTQTTVVHWPTS